MGSELGEVDGDEDHKQDDDGRVDGDHRQLPAVI